MIRSGENLILGIPVDVVRKSVKRIGIRIGRDGRVSLTVPKWHATLKDGEDFLLSKWPWVLKTRERVMAVCGVTQTPVSENEKKRLLALLDELNTRWCEKLCEPDVVWRIRRMKTLWGSCNFRRRRIVYSTELARVPREAVEYVVVHELTHLKAHDHGPVFKSLMDARLPGWRDIRRRLNRRETDPAPTPETPKRRVTLVQDDLFAPQDAARRA